MGLSLAALPPGSNRAEGPNALGVDCDFAAAQQFLAEYRGKPATLRTYTKEVERLLLWATLVRRKALSALDRQDFAAFSAFLADPQPRAQWCGPRRGRAGRRLEGGWRPFVGPLGHGAQHAALVVVGALMNYLVRAGYLRLNPLALMRRQRLGAADLQLGVERVQARSFDEISWRALCGALAPATGPHDAPPEAMRERFLVAVLYFMALRVGEVARHTMGHFRLLQGQWYFAVVGKGSKPALVPVNDAMLTELTLFRAALHLPQWPHPQENTALVPNLHQLQHGLGERRINQLLKALVDRAAATLAPEHAARAEHMRRASAHWFRHTSLTRQAQAGIPLAQLKENARHTKVDTTMLYLHSEREARHATMQRHGWQAPTPDDLPGGESLPRPAYGAGAPAARPNALAPIL